MAVYKVAQDVEADDKLIGPFSFRQFIYLIIVAMSGAIGWGLFTLLPPLVVFAIPPILFFGALALPLRKDQPMEVYMAALVSYILKPKKRLWVPDGIDSLVQITAPKVVEIERIKSLGAHEAERRLSYLADIIDTEGWAIRHTAVPGDNSSMQSDVYNDAQQAEDIMDASTGIAQSFDTMIAEADQRRRMAVMQSIQQPHSSPEPTAPSSYTQSIATEVVDTTGLPDRVSYDPYPTIHQSVIQPLSSTDQVQASEPQPDTSTSGNTVSPGIMNLVNNGQELSVETLQREANRIREREERADENEVVISLR